MTNTDDIKNFIIDLFFPNRCPFCDDFIRWDMLCCNICYPKIEWVDDNKENGCQLCGKNKCNCNIDVYFDECYSAAYYTGVVRDAVIKLKSYEETNFAKIIAEEITSQITESSYYGHIDYVIPVPMGKKKQRSKGYNHSELICDEIAELMKIKKRTDCIFKHDSDFAQHTMNLTERLENINNLFYTLPGISLKGKIVLLCDDVFTTGATINECARILRNAGAETILLAVAAKTKRLCTS